MKNPLNGNKPFDLCIVGGAGHVGLPLALVFANRGRRVLVYDINEAIFDTIRSGQMPFQEKGADAYLKKALQNNALFFTSDPAEIKEVPAVIVTIGTPIDQLLNPELKLIQQCFDELIPYISDGMLMVLRSTVYPGVTDWLDEYLKSKEKNVLLSFCPERVVQGLAIEEIQNHPQIISGVTPEAISAAEKLFQDIVPEFVVLTTMEAEFAKLFCNAYRYIQFAATNQFYMMADDAGLDYYRILEGMKKNYPRMESMFGAGFSAGPCLLKDTMQLAAFYQNRFMIGQTAMHINEGIPLYLVQKMSQRHNLKDMTVGLLGMAFKAEIDDPRSSLSYKLKKILKFRAKKVLTTDPFVTIDNTLSPLKIVLDESDILILCTPHSQYKNLDMKNKIVYDIWNFWGDE